MSEVKGEYFYSVGGTKYMATVHHLISRDSLEDDPEFYLEIAAEDYWNEHDGWDSSWPQTFSLFEKENDEEPIAVMFIEMEIVPSFSATKKGA